MNAQELRLNNWVTRNGKPEQVWSIMGNGDIGFDREFPIDAKHVTPIPLTAEILEKCGTRYQFGKVIADDTFILKGERKMTVKKYDDTQMRVWLDGGSIYIGIVHLEHLHQLQNLYFALTGTELIIKF